MQTVERIARQLGHTPTPARNAILPRLPGVYAICLSEDCSLDPFASTGELLRKRRLHNSTGINCGLHDQIPLPSYTLGGISMEDDSSIQRTFLEILRKLDSLGVSYSVLDYSASTVSEAEALPFPIESVVKCIALRVKGSGWALAALRAIDRLDYGKLARVLGVRRGEISLAAVEEVSSHLGFAHGTVSPLTVNGDPIVLLDTRLGTLPSLRCGAGVHGKTLELSFDSLQLASGGEVADLVRGE